MSAMVRMRLTLAAIIGATVAVSSCHAGNISYDDSVELQSSASVLVQVDWTGIGIFPQAEPYFGSGVAGEGLLDKDYVRIVCETYGQDVSNGQMYSNIWAEIDTGGYLPNSFLNTGVDGRTPDVPECGQAGVAGSSGSERSEIQNYSVSGVGTAWVFNGIVLPNTNATVVSWDGHLTTPLFNYWLSQEGGVVEVPWSYFRGDEHFIEWLNAQSFSSAQEEKLYTPFAGSDMRYSTGGVRIYNPTPGCYLLADTYNFDPDKVANLPYYALHRAEESGWVGRDFGIFATNC